MADHAHQVAALARARADKFGAGDLGAIAGLLHDIGKYSMKIKSKLDGANIRVDHSTFGARVAAEHDATLAQGCFSEAHAAAVRALSWVQSAPGFGHV